MSANAESKTISIVIPVYRNEGSLAETHRRLVAAINEAFPNYGYQIVFVDDGSDDGSFQELMNIREVDPSAIVLKLSRNFGQFAANNAGFQMATGDFVVNMSADLQDPPELVVDLIQMLLRGNDIALAVRKKTSESFFKELTSKLHYHLVRLSVPSYPKGGFDFWAVNRRAFDAFMSFSDVIRRNQIDLLSIGYKVGHIEYEKQQRVHGKSQNNFLKRLDISISQILSSAFWPLRLASSLGVIFTLLALVYAVHLFIAYFFRDAPFEGWTPIMLLILLFGGINMLILGVVGEYLWRIYFEAKRRPLYFVDRIYGIDSEDDK